MRGGIEPDENIISQYQDLKKGHTIKTMIFSIENDKLEIVFKGDKNFAYKDLFDLLPANEPRLILYDFDYETLEKIPRKTSKIILILWCPMSSVALKRFVYSNSVKGIADSLGGVQSIFQADDFQGIDYDTIKKQL